LLIVDDRLHSRHALRALLSAHPDFQLIGEAANGREALDLLKQAEPDVVLMDVRMPVMDGITATRLVKQQFPHVKILILSEAFEYQGASLEAGADAFLSKGEREELLLRTLRSLARGSWDA
jgi:YesN/AraC family two-component response regulator